MPTIRFSRLNTAVGGDFLHASTFQPQRWFGLQSNRRFPDSVPFGRALSSDRGRKPDFAVKLALRHRTSNNIRSRREQLFQSLRAFFSSPVVICKGDSNASIRVWEKLMKPGELLDVS